MDRLILGVPYDIYTKDQILEYIEKYLKVRKDFFHIVSINPEVVLLARKNRSFKEVLTTAHLRICDGAGIVAAVKILGGPIPYRMQGVDLMQQLLEMANQHSLTVMLIGGSEKIADRVVNCQKKRYPRINFISLQGIKNILKPTSKEESRIFSIVAEKKPHFIFAAFGSPYQELWFHRHKRLFIGSVCMGVGGAFDFLSGRVPRAPKIMRYLGLEWFFRLLVQPWRISRQIKLIQYISIVLIEKINQLVRK